MKIEYEEFDYGKIHPEDGPFCWEYAEKSRELIPHRKPSVDGSWICPYCGKRVYSMEVHPCNQPYCKEGKW